MGSVSAATFLSYARKLPTTYMSPFNMCAISTIGSVGFLFLSFVFDPAPPGGRPAELLDLFSPRYDVLTKFVHRNVGGGGSKWTGPDSSSAQLVIGIHS